MVTVRDALRGHGSVARSSISSGFYNGTEFLKVLAGHFLVSSKKIMRRIMKITWKFATISLFYGMIVHISILQAKILLCRICQQYLNRIKAPHFWILLGLLAVGFALLNLQIIRYLRGKIFNGKQKLKKQKMFGTTFSRYPVSKTTRSGCIYGYM